MPCYLGEPFQHDLFVSYSHGAFKGQHDSDLKLWSQKFAESLRNDLAGTLEFEDISVYLDQSERADESVDRTADLPDHLKQRLHASALLTVLMTPHYLRSDWCRQEREWWREKNDPDTLGAGGRIFICRVRPTDAKTWPKELPAAVGYYCYDQNKHPDKARPFTWLGADDDLNLYKNLLIDLSGDLMERLRKIKAVLDERRRQEEQVRKYAESNGQILFLHGRPHATAAWDRASDRLQESGFYVVPDRPIPVAADGGLDPEYRTQLVNSDGVLLLGAEDGRALDTDIIVIGRNFRNLAAASRPFLPCAVLNIAGEPLRTPRRLKNVNNLRMGWIDSTIDDSPLQVRSWLLEAGARMELVA
jgi:hypothetical protein